MKALLDFVESFYISINIEWSTKNTQVRLILLYNCVCTIRQIWEITYDAYSNPHLQIDRNV